MKLDFLDIISDPITLYSHGNLKHSSCFSIILSLAVLLFVLIVSIVLIQDFIFHKNPTCFSFKSYTKDAGNYSLKIDIPHFITFGEDVSNFTYNKTAFSIIGVDIYDYEIFENNNETLYDHWIYDSCEENDLGDNIKYLDKDYIESFKKGLCIRSFYI